jgi:hypothetical protein
VVITDGVLAAAGSPDVALVVTSAAAGALAGDHLPFPDRPVDHRAVDRHPPRPDAG